MNIAIALSALVGLGAHWILWLLIALSILGVAIIAERCAFFWSSRDDQKELSSLIQRQMTQGSLEELDQKLSESPSFEARVARRGILAREGADEEMLAETHQVKLEMERYLAFLGTVGSNAPFVGLLGTVIGIIGAFHQLGQSQGALSEGLMSEIGEALVATAVGLLVALPAIAAFNMFRRVIQTRLSRADAVRCLILGLWKRRAAGDALPGGE